MRSGDESPVARRATNGSGTGHFSDDQAAWRGLEEPAARKSYRYALRPTPEQERALERTLLRSRHLDNAAVGERRAAWRKCGVSVSYPQHKAELPDIKEAPPEYGAVHRRVVQDVVPRVDRAYRACFRRVQAGEKPGYPRFQGRNRYNSSADPPVGEQGGTRVDDGFPVLSTIGRIAIAVRWSRPPEGTPKTVTIAQEADGWYARIARAEVPIHPRPLTGRATGRDVGLESFATPADGARIHTPRWYRKAERRRETAHRRVSRRKQGSNRRRKAVKLLAKAHQTVPRHRQDVHRKTALALARRGTTPSLAKTYGPPTCARATISPRASRMRDGRGSCAPCATRPQAPVAHRSRTARAPLAHRSLSGRRAPRRHQPDVLWLRRAGLEGTLGAVADRPRLRDEPAPRPHQREAPSAGRAGPSGSVGRWATRRTENPPPVGVGSVNLLCSAVAT